MNLLALVFTVLSSAPGADATINDAVIEEGGVRVHRVVSSLQSGPTQIRVVVSPGVEPSARAPTVYVLPVEANRETRYGDGLQEILDRKLHLRHRAIYVAPTFAQLPWYADHPTRSDLRQERYFVEVVMPHVERAYPAIRERRGRLLLGFSKSGWGAWTLLLRHPETFERAAAWDAPLQMDRPGRYGSGEIFGDDATFQQYRVTELLRKNGDALRVGGLSRLILTGYDNFRGDHVQTHAFLEELRIPHQYQDGPRRAHDWHSGWVAESLDALLTPDLERP